MAQVADTTTFIAAQTDRRRGFDADQQALDAAPPCSIRLRPS